MLLSATKESLFRDVISSVNHEVRAVLLVHCLPRPQPEKTGITPSNMRTSVITLTKGDDKIKIPSVPSFEGYCEEILLPRGFIEKRGFTNKSGRSIYANYANEYWLSAQGILYVQPSAALAIKATNDFNQSLLDVLGKTGTPNSTSRPAYNTVKILMELYEKTEMRESDLVKLVGLYRSDVRDHCVRLAQVGFIGREVLPVARPKSYTPYNREAYDRITDTGKAFVESFLLKIQNAIIDKNYLYTGFRLVLEEYLSDLPLLKVHARKALEIYSCRK
ncbi:MAG: hypothetical protein HYS80_02070 [Candidatus Aenigmarchaeota archaeon]|nr:hypothetical protein [Candidatus Aenigmarchaeota archaeon]